MNMSGRYRVILLRPCCHGLLATVDPPLRLKRGSGENMDIRYAYTATLALKPVYNYVMISYLPNFNISFIASHAISFKILGITRIMHSLIP